MNNIDINKPVFEGSNFTYRELCASDTARAKGIDNIPTSEQTFDNLKYLVEQCLQPARNFFGEPLRVTSGFRSAELNKAIGGSNTSFHSIGCAADVKFNSNSVHKLCHLFDYFYTQCKFTELIAEELPGGWLHIAIQKGREQERQVKYKLVNKPVVRADYDTIRKLIS